MLGIHRTGAFQKVNHRVFEELAGLDPLMFGRKPGEVAQNNALGQSRLPTGRIAVANRGGRTLPTPTRGLPVPSDLRGEPPAPGGAR